MSGWKDTGCSLSWRHGLTFWATDAHWGLCLAFSPSCKVASAMVHPAPSMSHRPLTQYFHGHPSLTPESPALLHPPFGQWTKPTAPPAAGHCCCPAHLPCGYSSVPSSSLQDATLSLGPSMSHGVECKPQARLSRGHSCPTFFSIWRTSLSSPQAPPSSHTLAAPGPLDICSYPGNHHPPPPRLRAAPPPAAGPVGKCRCTVMAASRGVPSMSLAPSAELARRARAGAKNGSITLTLGGSSPSCPPSPS